MKDPGFVSDLSSPLKSHIYAFKGVETAQRNVFSVCISSGVLSYGKQPARGVSTDSVCWLLDEPSTSLS